jgi:hypothetical protein
MAHHFVVELVSPWALGVFCRSRKRPVTYRASRNIRTDPSALTWTLVTSRLESVGCGGPPNEKCSIHTDISSVELSPQIPTPTCCAAIYRFSVSTPGYLLSLAATHQKLSPKIISFAKWGGRYPSSALSVKSSRSFSMRQTWTPEGHELNRNLRRPKAEPSCRSEHRARSKHDLSPRRGMSPLLRMPCISARRTRA